MKELLLDWNPWWSKTFEFQGIPRTNIKNITPWIKRREIISITGVRRSGKTTLLYEIISTLIKEKTNPKYILFIKADDDRIKNDNLIDNLIEEYKQWINPKSENYNLFIDEIQEIKDWGKTLKRLYDLNPKLKIFISGSNAKILKEELGTSLAGRYANFEVYPFSFNEVLYSKNIYFKNDIELQKNSNIIKHTLIEYIETGGFPEVILEKNINIKKELIKFYFDSIFYRDLIKRNSVRNPAKMEVLIKLLLQNVSNQISYNKIGKLVGLTTDTIIEYIKLLENAYFIFTINIYEFSYKKQIINPKKVYCVDNGIRNIIGFKFSEDIGRLKENIVFIELKRRNKEVYYWKNKNECDFIIKKEKELEAIQVTHDINKSYEREINGLLEAMKTLKIKNGTIITDNLSKTEIVDNKKIIYTPLWKWLLEY